MSTKLSPLASQQAQTQNEEVKLIENHNQNQSHAVEVVVVVCDDKENPDQLLQSTMQGYANNENYYDGLVINSNDIYKQSTEKHNTQQEQEKKQLNDKIFQFESAFVQGNEQQFHSKFPLFIRKLNDEYYRELQIYAFLCKNKENYRVFIVTTIFRITYEEFLNEKQKQFDLELQQQQKEPQKYELSEHQKNCLKLLPEMYVYDEIYKFKVVASQSKHNYNNLSDELELESYNISIHENSIGFCYKQTVLQKILFENPTQDILNPGIQVPQLNTHNEIETPIKRKADNNTKEKITNLNFQSAFQKSIDAELKRVQ